MLGALFYLRFMSLRNRLMAGIRRLRQPKYLAGALAGAAYFYYFLFRPMRLPVAAISPGDRGEGAVPLADLVSSGAVVIAALLLLGQQLVGDGGYTVYDIAQVSLRQARVDDTVMGRVLASSDFVVTLVTLVATILGGAASAMIGLRASMALGVLGGAVAVVLLWRSPVRQMSLPDAAGPKEALYPGDDLPLTE